MSIFEGLFRSYLQDTTCYELEEGVASGGTTFFLPDCCEVWTGATVKVVMRRIILSVISVVLLSGCSPYQVREFSTPSIEPPVHFSEKFDQPLLNLEGRKTAPYWTQYGAPKLETLVSAAFENNFSLSEVIARIEQVRAQAQVAGAGRFPQLTVEGTGRRTRVETRTPIFAGGFTPATQIIQNQFAVSNGLSYELDLWERVASTNRAALLRVRATETELESSALSLSGEVFRQWMTALEAVQLERVLEEQIETSKTFLELTELRFSLSQGTALDVFDQRQQLASLRTQLPRVEMSRDQALHRLAVLTGQAPGAVTLEAVGDFFHVVPEWIPDVRPADLIVLRPDLRSILFQLQASEYDVAAAVADRFPRLTVGFQYNFTTPDLDSLFPNKTLSGFGGLLLPLIDGGRRRGVVRSEKADVDQLLAQFTDRYLTALQEVEDALSSERHQRELLRSLREQLAAAEDALSESKSRYVNGLSDYLRVLVALQTTQNLERSVISEERQLREFRNQLLLALGGRLPSVHEPAAGEIAESEDHSDNKENTE